MKITLFLTDKIIDFKLPLEASGSFSFDENIDEEDKLINIEARDDKWFLYSTNEAKVLENNIIIESTILVPNRFYVIRRNNLNYLIFVTNVEMSEVKVYNYNNSLSLIIGTTEQCNLLYNCPYLQNLVVKFSVKENRPLMEKSTNIPVYVNKVTIRDASFILKSFPISSLPFVSINGNSLCMNIVT